MENNIQPKDEKKPNSGVVHILLSHSYATFFFAVVFGVVCDIIFSVRIFNGVVYEYTGIVLLVLGSILVYWSQSTTRHLGKSASSNRDVNFFLHGPYKYIRNPTNLGLTVTIIGLGLLINSLFSIIFILITYIISKIFFIKKQDAILEERYGQAFLDYKKTVKDWI